MIKERLTMSDIEKRLEELGYSLPDVPTPVGAYRPGMQVGKLIYVSGQTSWLDGRQAYRGKVGREISEEEAVEAARIVALNLLAELKAVTGDLDKIEHIIKVNGYVNAVPEFERHPFVINGCSNLLLEVFGERGTHARAAIGVASLPDNAPVEIELVASVKD